MSNLPDKIAKLRTRTTARGASDAEAETAAKTIGRLIMENPELQVVLGGARSRPRFSESSGDWITLEGCTSIRRTEKAIQFETDGDQFWIPKSCIDFNASALTANRVVVKSWFVEKELDHIFGGVYA